jgi:hypothetical protein
LIRTWRAVDACNNTGTQTQTNLFKRSDIHQQYAGTIGAIPCNPTQAQIDAAVGAPTVVISASRINSNIYDAAETGAPGCTELLFVHGVLLMLVNNTVHQTQTILFQEI